MENPGASFHRRFKQDTCSKTKEPGVLMFEGVAHLPDEVTGVKHEGEVDLVAIALNLTGGKVPEASFSSSDDMVFVRVDLALVDSFLPQGRMGAVTKFPDEEVVEGQ